MRPIGPKWRSTLDSTAAVSISFSSRSFYLGSDRKFYRVGFVLFFGVRIAKIKGPLAAGAQLQEARRRRRRDQPHRTRHLQVGTVPPWFLQT